MNMSAFVVQELVIKEINAVSLVIERQWLREIGLLLGRELSPLLVAARRAICGGAIKWDTVAFMVGSKENMATLRVVRERNAKKYQTTTSMRLFAA